ncbi:MAG: hypothetical protein M1543_01080 [Firmicutes bacterium]|nr:hypothetical protein [Bacillota bacterium]
MAGVIIGLVLLIFLVYRRLSIVIAAPVSAIVVALINFLPPAQVLSAYLAGMGDFIQKFFLLFLLGAVFGNVYGDSGAALTLGRGLGRLVGKQHTVTAIALTGATLTFGGVSSFVVIFTLYPVGMALLREANLPERLFMAAFGVGTVTFAMTAPGSPQIQNLLPIGYMHTTATAGLIPGTAAAAVIGLSGMIYLERQAAVACRRKEGFSGESFHAEKRTLPSLWKSVLPLSVTVLLLDVFKWEPAYAMTGGVAAALLCLYRYLEEPVQTLNRGAGMAGLALLSAASSVAFGTAARQVPGFVAGINRLMQIRAHPLIIAALVTNLAVAVTGSSNGGLALAITVTQGHLATTGADPALLHRVMVLASGVLDTLPHNNSYLTALVVTGLSHRNTYKEYFFATVLIPFLGLAVAMAIIFWQG